MQSPNMTHPAWGASGVTASCPGGGSRVNARAYALTFLFVKFARRATIVNHFLTHIQFFMENVNN